jgi:hypothetical protein
MANINGVDPPVLNDTDYVNKIINSFTAVDNHDHTSGKGLPIPSAGIADGSVTTVKIQDGAVTEIKIGSGAVNLATKVSGVLPVANGGTGSSTRNFVDLSSTESITGVKTFSNGLVTGGGGSSTLGGITNVSDVFNLTAGAELRAQFVTDTTAGTLTALGTSGRISIRLTLATILQGLANGSMGDIVIIENANTVDLTIAHDNAGATAANRILIEGGSDRVIRPNGLAILIYDTNASRWFLLSGGGQSSPRVTSFTGTTITTTPDSSQKFRYTGASAQTLASISVAAGLPDGARVSILGTSDTNTLTVQSNDSANGILLNGQIELGRGSRLELEWDAGLARYVEVCRNA